MKNPRKVRFRVVSIAFLLALISITASQVARQIRQTRLDRSLLAAIRKNDTAQALSLLSMGADANATDAPPSWISAFQWMWDKLRGQEQTRTQESQTALQVLLTKNPEGWEDARVSVIHPENPVLAEALLARGANPNVEDKEGNTPLALAADTRFDQTLMLLLDRGANPNAQDQRGTSAIGCAALQGDVIAMRRLLKQGANPTAACSDWTGRTIDCAIAGGNKECVRLLLDRGAPLEGTVFKAIQYRELNVLELLLEREASIKDRGWNGATVLHEAAMESHDTRMIKMLLERGADTLARDKDGKTPLETAQLYGLESVANVLRQAERKQRSRHVNARSVPASSGAR